MGKRKITLLIINIICFSFLMPLGANAATESFGWEDGSLAGWRGNIENSTTHYYNGRHSLALNLNFDGNGFTNKQISISNYSGEPKKLFIFKIYIPSVPEIPIDLKSQIYIKDSQGNAARSRWSFLLGDKWNELSLAVPSNFKEPLTLTINFGTQFQYKGKIYIDQAQSSSLEITPDTMPAFYNTYIPSPRQQEVLFQPAPAASNQKKIITMISFGTLNSSSEQEDAFNLPLNYSSAGLEVFEHETLLLISAGICIFGLKLKKMALTIP